MRAGCFSVHRTNQIPSFALLMRRLCFLLLAFLFPMQLFAGMLESAPKVVVQARIAHAVMDSVSVTLTERLQNWAAPLQLPLDVDDLIVAATASDLSQDADHPQGQPDLEEQTLPAMLATLALDWHPFPHLLSHVSDGTSAFIDLLRPPPLTAA
jgi:hypothetical protein